MSKGLLNILVVLVPISVIYHGQFNGLVITVLFVWAGVVGFKEGGNTLKNKELALSLSLFFLLIFITIVDFSNGEFSLKILERYLPTLLIPVIWYFLSKKVDFKKVLNTVIWVISSINVALIVFGIYRGFTIKEKVFGVWSRLETLEFYANYKGGFNSIFLTYTKIIEPLSIDPAYYGLLVNFVIVFLWRRVVTEKKIIEIVLISLNVIFVFLLANKANIIALGVIGLYYLIPFLNSPNSIWRISSRLFLVGLVVMPFLIPSTRLRIENSCETVLSELVNRNEKNNQQKLDPSTNERIILWNEGGKMFLEKPAIGWGSIYGEIVLTKRTGIEKNSHNQFVKFAISGGLIGIILMLMYLFLPLLFVNDKQYFIAFIIIVCVNLMFENVLDRQWGLVLIPFFYKIFRIK